MVKITFIEHDTAAEHTVEVSPGVTLMEAARKNSVPGILADCGGACACATCHVYIGDDISGLVEPAQEMELSMLEFADNVEPNSRLSCQIKVSEAFDGARVLMPPNQI